MVQGTFVLSAYRQKNPQEQRKVDYRQSYMRYVVVVIAIFVVFGCEYCFDNASALQTYITGNLERQDKPINQFEFNLLYALYAFPNIIIPLLGGVMIDKYGARIVLIITACFCLAGHLVFGYGGLQNSFGIMLAGRVIFGIGGEVLHSSQNTLISNWFKANELSMVLGICLSFPKMGSSLNSYVSPKLADNFGQQNNLNVAGPIFVGAGIMFISVILAVVLAYIDRKSQMLQKRRQESALLGSATPALPVVVEEPSQLTKQPSQNDSSNEVNIVMTSDIGENNKEGAEGGQHLNFKQIGKLPMAFWLIILISMLSEALFIPFLDNVFDIPDAADAGIYLIVPYCVSSLFVVIFGYFVQKVQKRSYVLMVSCGFFTFTYLFMMVTEATASMRNTEIVRWIPSFLLGICIAIFCSIIVPTVPMLVQPKLLGTGFGIMEMLQNLALGVFPLVGGALRATQEENEAQGFHLQTLFFFLISCICFGVSLLLKAVDVTSGRRLDVKDFRKHYLQKFAKQGNDQDKV